jgi:hypothetical protein
VIEIDWLPSKGLRRRLIRWWYCRRIGHSQVYMGSERSYRTTYAMDFYKCVRCGAEGSRHG